MKLNDQILRSLENVNDDGQFFKFVLALSKILSVEIVLTVIDKLSDSRLPRDSLTKFSRRFFSSSPPCLLKHTILLANECPGFIFYCLYGSPTCSLSSRKKARENANIGINMPRTLNKVLVTSMNMEM